jgi:hypothetical protein
MASVKKKNRQARSSRAMDASTKDRVWSAASLSLFSMALLRCCATHSSTKPVPASALVLATEFAKAILAGLRAARARFERRR